MFARSCKRGISLHVPSWSTRRLYDEDDDDEGRINFSVALSPIRLQGHVTISLNSEVTK